MDDSLSSNFKTRSVAPAARVNSEYERDTAAVLKPRYILYMRNEDSSPAVIVLIVTVGVRLSMSACPNTCDEGTYPSSTWEPPNANTKHSDDCMAKET